MGTSYIKYGFLRKKKVNKFSATVRVLDALMISDSGRQLSGRSDAILSYFECPCGSNVYSFKPLSWRFDSKNDEKTTCSADYA